METASLYAPTASDLTLKWSLELRSDRAEVEIPSNTAYRTYDYLPETYTLIVNHAGIEIMRLEGVRLKMVDGAVDMLIRMMNDANRV